MGPNNSENIFVSIECCNGIKEEQPNPLFNIGNACVRARAKSTLIYYKMQTYNNNSEPDKTMLFPAECN